MTTEYTTRIAFQGLKGHSHMTISFVGTSYNSEIVERLEDIANSITSSCFTVYQHDDFGPHRNIRVSLVQVDDPNVLEKLLSFHRDFGVAEKGLDVKLDVPNFHISREELPIGTRLVPKSVEIKPLGPNDPIHSFGVSL